MATTQARSAPAVHEATGFFLALFSALCYSTEAVATKFLYGYGLPALTVLVWRSLAAAALFAAAALWRRTLLPSPGQRLPLVVTGCLQALTILSLYYAFARLPAGLAILLLYLYPAFVTLGGTVFFAERLTPARLGGLLLTFTGLVIVTGAPASTLLLSGAVYALLAALGNAAFLLLSSRFLEEVPVLTVSTWTIGTAALFFLALALPQGLIRLATAVPPVLFLLAFLALVPTVFALASLLGAVARIGPSRTAIIATLEPLFTALLGYLLLGERLAPQQLLGGLLILVAVALQRR
ncbi:MAG TPA: DMT family transporter [Firmicutes bacterium]|nr:DMT family transporter [Bacillota bacterium]